MTTTRLKSGDFMEGNTGNRRDFLRRIGIGSATAIGMAGLTDLSRSPAQGAAASPSGETAALPTIKIGGKTVTRLLVGGNPIHGYSQPTLHVSRHMTDYFTVERTADLFLHCEKVGINTFQGSYSDKVRDALRLVWERGSKIQWICLATDDASTLEKILELKPIALAHHGGVTDRFFRDGKSDAVRDFVKRIHDKGLPVGVSSHVPANIRAVEEKDWGNDFFMACFYNVVRRAEEIRREFGMAPVDNLYYLADDPKIMTEVIRQSRKPCLAFKILAAGRLCWNDESVAQAFQFAFRNIKPTDGVIVGMYPRFADEPQQNAALTRQYGVVA